MKKFLAVFVLAAFLSPAFCAQSLSQKTGVVGLDLPTIGVVNKKDGKAGGIISTTGINLGLGISHKNYFEVVKANGWNAWWGIGTLVVIVPYVGIGVDYVWDSGWYFGVGLPTGVQLGYLF